jgi:L-ascorbate metabolism protein UlaG (beta-lactamase superfamily)
LVLGGGHHSVPHDQSITTSRMIQPALRDAELLADIAEADPAPDRLHLWWLGQSGFLLKWEQQYLVFDPYLSDSLTQKYAGSDKPHVRMTARPIAPEQLDFVHVVTSSHNHTDHLDADTLLPLMHANPDVHLLVPAANRRFAAERLGVALERLVPINAGQSVALSGFTIYAIPAAHDELEQDDQGRFKHLGYVVRAGQWTVYHSGDTRLFPDLAAYLRPWNIDVAMLPINGHAPERRVPGNLSGREAAWLARQIDARLAIPCHYEMFTFNTSSPDEFVSEARRIGQPVCVLRCGQRWSGSR